MFYTYSQVWHLPQVQSRYLIVTSRICNSFVYCIRDQSTPQLGSIGVNEIGLWRKLLSGTAMTDCQSVGWAPLGLKSDEDSGDNPLSGSRLTADQPTDHIQSVTSEITYVFLRPISCWVVHVLARLISSFVLVLPRFISLFYFVLAVLTFCFSSPFWEQKHVTWEGLGSLIRSIGQLTDRDELKDYVPNYSVF